MSDYKSREEKMACLRSAYTSLAGASEALARAGFGSLAYLEVTPVQTTVGEIIGLLEGEEC